MKVIKTKYIFALLILCFVGLEVSGQSSTETSHTPSIAINENIDKHEVRAVWLTTIKNLDWPKTFATSKTNIEKQKNELCEILDRLATAGINMVMLQTRVRANTIYPSAYEPWSEVITGKAGKAPLDYDPLQFAIEECHKRKMELHAWVVTIPIGKWKSHGCQTLYKKHPKMVKHIKDEGFLNIEHPQTAKYISDICREITEKYDVDGIHLDYIRYPETWKISINKDKARANVTAIVKEIHRTVKDIKPWVKVSCAPIGKYCDLTRYSSMGWNAYDRVAQDAQSWLKEGYMDMLLPMMYFDGKHFYPFVMDWAENRHGRIVAAGLGTYLLHPTEKNWDVNVIERQINVARAVGLGYAHFRSQFFTDDNKGIYRMTIDKLNRHPALIPPMTWQSSVPPQTPKHINLRRFTAGDELSWDAVSDYTYNIYASLSYPVDIHNPANLIGVRMKRPVVSIPASALGHQTGGLHYAVTTIDRYGNESIPIATPPIEEKTNWRTTLINDGKTLNIPIDETMFDADFASIETLQGSIIALKPWHKKSVDISDIPNGMYVVKSLGRKGVTHRLGYFTIKRY